MGNICVPSLRNGAAKDDTVREVNLGKLIASEHEETAKGEVL